MIRNILRIMALALLLTAGLQVRAQFRYAAVAGATISDLHFKQDLAPVSTAVGGQAGVMGELMFPGIGFGMDLGLMYNMAGANVNFGDKLIWQSQGYGDERLMLHQLNIPFHFRFKFTRLSGLEDVIAPFVYGGPEFSILLAHGNCKAVQYAGGDISLAAGGGVELWRRWQVSASYTWGMSYALKTRLLQDYSARSRQWTVRVAYFF